MFDLEHLFITDAAREAFERNREDVLDYVARHTTVDAVANGKRIVSSYKLKDHTIIWIMTAPDHSTAMIAMPYEI